MGKLFGRKSSALNPVTAECPGASYLAPLVVAPSAQKGCSMEMAVPVRYC